MASYIFRRILIAIPILFGVTILNFIIIYMAPGNPVDMYFNPNATEQEIQLKKEALGLNDPIWIQYVNWLKELLNGNLGYSFSSYQAVSEILAERIGPTLLLMGTALILAYLIAIPIGILSATRQYSFLDYFTTGASFLGVSLPNFFLGLLAIYIFALKLQWLPTGGMYTLGSENNLWDWIRHLILPALVLSISIAGKMVRYVRSSMLDVLGQDYLRTARSKGLRESIITNKHALRNALIPIVTVIGADIPLLLGGAVVTEQIFQWPGIGQLTITSILTRDYPVLMAINLMSAVVVMVSNILTDIVYTIVDPKVKYK